MVSPKLLYLCHRIPYPPNKGDKIRSFNEIRFLAKDHTIDLVTLADDPADLAYAKDLETYCRTVQVFSLNKKTALIKGGLSLVSGSSITRGYFYQARFQKAVNRLMAAHRYDTILCFSSPMARYVFNAPATLYPETPAGTGTVTSADTVTKPGTGAGTNSANTAATAATAAVAATHIMDFCDLDSDKWRQYAEKKPFPLNRLYRLEADRLLAFEKQINRSFHKSVFVSEKEAGLFRQYDPDAANICVIPNGVDHDYFNPVAVPTATAPATAEATSDVTAPAPSAGKASATPAPPHHRTHPSGSAASADESRPVAAFFGAMDYYANVDGAQWFAREILPAVRNQIPDVLFYIVGSNPDPALTALAAADPNIRITGFVDDIRPWYTRAQVCVIPLRIARGVQNKVLEAMAMEKAIVTTSPAVQGIALPPEPPLEITDDPARFAAHVTT
ncbi:MAG: glycosyltransferase, partial [Desulfobacteraceae bacterium]|nr:glycosyltransferase [Desulfobacteraceae bacterium]